MTARSPAFSIARSDRSWPSLIALAVIGLVALPVLSLLAIALSGNIADWSHLAQFVFPRAGLTTLLLMIGVGSMTLVTGTATAWLVTAFRFPGRDVLASALLLPLAMPTYIVAYGYADLMDFAGPLQTGIRWLMAARGRSSWFPDIHSLGGAIFVLSAVLYPYVYLNARASFLRQSQSALDAARTLGRSASESFFEVALPMARPALAAGVALALMESLNDIGAMQHLGVETLTVAAYATWVQRSSLAGAGGLALLMLLLVGALFAVERWSRRGSTHHGATTLRAMPGEPLLGARAWLATLVCTTPVVLGFAVPVLVLAHGALRHLDEVLDSGFWRAALTSLLLAGVAAGIATAIGLAVAYSRRIAPSGLTKIAGQCAGLGYAIPGTVLAIGLLLPLAGLDNWVDGLMRAWFGISTGLLLSGSFIALLLAYQVRFLAMALGSIEAGFGRISPNVDAAARTLGETSASTLQRVLLPMLRPAIGAGALLVFVDTMKELPATLLLRPFDTDTLATRVYSFAALEQVETAGLAALMIVAAGLLPLILLQRTIDRGGFKRSSAAAPAASAVRQR